MHIIYCCIVSKTTKTARSRLTGLSKPLLPLSFFSDRIIHLLRRFDEMS